MYAHLGCSTCAQPCSQCAKRNTCANSTAPDVTPGPGPSVWGYVLAGLLGLLLGKGA